jgi:hypothetical protein
MRKEEHRLQVSCVRWYRYQYPQYRALLFAVPNGGKRDVRTAVNLKAEGVVSGVADLLLLMPRHHVHGLCIEMKTIKGRQTEAQKEWQLQVERQGYAYSIIRSLPEFIAVLEAYIGEH